MNTYNNQELGVVIEAQQQPNFDPEISQDVTKRSNYKEIQDNSQQKNVKTDNLEDYCQQLSINNTAQKRIEQTAVLNINQMKNSNSAIMRQSIASNSSMGSGTKKSIKHQKSQSSLEDTNKLLNMHQYDVYSKKQIKQVNHQHNNSSGSLYSLSQQYRLRKTPSQRKSLITDEMIFLNQEHEKVTTFNIDTESNSVTNFVHEDEQNNQDLESSEDQCRTGLRLDTIISNQVDQQSSLEMENQNFSIKLQEVQTEKMNHDLQAIQSNNLSRTQLLNHDSSEDLQISVQKSIKKSNQKEKQQNATYQKRIRTPLKNSNAKLSTGKKKARYNQENQSPFGITNYFKTIQSLTSQNRNHQLITSCQFNNQSNSQQIAQDFSFENTTRKSIDSLSNNSFTLREKKSNNYQTCGSVLQTKKSQPQTKSSKVTDNSRDYQNSMLQNSNSAKKLLVQSQNILEAYKALRKSKERQSFGKCQGTQQVAKKQINKSVVLYQSSGRNTSMNMVQNLNKDLTILNHKQSQKPDLKPKKLISKSKPSHSRQNHSISSLSNLSGITHKQLQTKQDNRSNLSTFATMQYNSLQHTQNIDQHKSTLETKTQKQLENIQSQQLQNLNTQPNTNQASLSTSHISNRSQDPLNSRTQNPCSNQNSQSHSLIQTQKTALISQNIKEKQTIISAKNELLLFKQQEKRDITNKLAEMKKEKLQMLKSTKSLKHQNLQIQCDIMKLNQCVGLKGNKQAQFHKEILPLKKDIKQLQSQTDSQNNHKKQLDINLMQEYELLEAISQTVLNYKKQINDARKEKEKIGMAVKQQVKQIEMLANRRDQLQEDSNKLFQDFQETMQLQKQQN
eukprot:403358486